MQICGQFSPVHLERLFDYQKQCMIKEKEKYEENYELTFPRHFKEKRLIHPKVETLKGKIEGEITRVTPRYFPSTDTARLQKVAEIMELQPAFTLKLMLQDFPPETFSHADIHEELMVPSGIYRS